MKTYLYLVNEVGTGETAGIKKIRTPLTAVNAENEGEVHDLAIVNICKEDRDVNPRTLEVLVCNPFCG